MRIRENHIPRLLIAVRLLADRLTDKERIRSLPEVRGVRHRSGESLRSDQDKEVALAVQRFHFADRLDHVLETKREVASGIKPQIDHKVFRMLREQIPQNSRCILQILVRPESTVARPKLLQILAPEGICRPLQPQGRSLNGLHPATFRCVRIRARGNLQHFQPAVVRKHGVAYRIAAGQDSQPVQHHALPEKRRTAHSAKSFGFIGRRQCQKELSHTLDRNVADSEKFPPPTTNRAAGVSATAASR